MTTAGIESNRQLVAKTAAIYFAQQWLTDTVRGLVDDHTECAVTSVPTADGATFLVTGPPAELGRIIGRAGRNARALRTLLHARSMRDGIRYTLDIDDNQKQEEVTE